MASVETASVEMASVEMASESPSKKCRVSKLNDKDAVFTMLKQFPGHFLKTAKGTPLALDESTDDYFRKKSDVLRVISEKAPPPYCHSLKKMNLIYIGLSVWAPKFVDGQSGEEIAEWLKNLK